MAERPPPSGSRDDVSAPSNTGAVAGAPRWVKTFGIVMLLLLVVFVALHMTGRQLGGHMPSGAHQQHMSGAGSP